MPPPHHPPAAARRTASVLAAVATLLLAATTAAAPPAAADPTRTPTSALSADGRSATDGVRTLAVSQSQGLAPTGQQVRVTGSGYDSNKGVYVALCVIPPANALPTPCGGGVDTAGQAGASQWISSNPPSYGAGLARPYGPGGSFDTTFTVNPTINATVDCRFVRCGILTRNDHTRSADRSQDIVVPISFAQPATPGAPPAAPPPPGEPGAAPEPVPTAPAAAPTTAAPATTTTTTTTTPPAPEAIVDEDGTSVTDGVRTLRVDGANELGLDGDVVTVEGTGFDTSRGVYVSLCAIGDDAAHPPAPCATGDDRSVWLSNDPPEWGAELAVPFDEGGSFEVQLDVEPVIDDTTDCAETRCAITVRADDTAAADRSLDLALPVTFTEVDPPEVAEATTTRDTDDDADDELATSTISEDSDSPAGVLIAVAAAVALILPAGAGLWSRRRRASSGEGGPTSGDGPTVGVA